MGVPIKPPNQTPPIKPDNKQFLRDLPSGFHLALPMGPRLERSFEILGLPTE